jgi:uncharacterized membrane protein YdjX (TVP38/TMEM64 family)
MRPLIRPVLFVVFVALLVAAYRTLDLGRHMSPDGMKALVESAGAWGPVVFMGICVAGIFMHFPEILLVALGGVALGGPQAFAYDHFQRVLSGRFVRLRALDDRLARDGFRTVLVLRLVLFMAPPLNWLLGATRVRLPHYVAGTALGLIPGMATTVYFADSIANRPAGESVGLRVVVAALLVVGFLSVARIAGRRVLGREQPAARP